MQIISVYGCTSKNQDNWSLADNLTSVSWGRNWLATFITTKTKTSVVSSPIRQNFLQSMNNSTLNVVPWFTNVHWVTNLLQTTSETNY